MECSARASRRLWWRDWEGGYTLSRWRIDWCLFLVLFCDVLGSVQITVKLHYVALQRQLSQGCTIFIDSYYVICKNMRNYEVFVNYAVGCNSWSIVQNHTITQYQRPSIITTIIIIINSSSLSWPSLPGEHYDGQHHCYHYHYLYILVIDHHHPSFSPKSSSFLLILL